MRKYYIKTTSRIHDDIDIALDHVYDKKHTQLPLALGTRCRRCKLCLHNNITTLYYCGYMGWPESIRCFIYTVQHHAHKYPSTYKQLPGGMQYPVLNNVHNNEQVPSLIGENCHQTHGETK